MDRSEYYKNMYARKKESLQNDSFVNPSDSNDFGQYAEMQTEMEMSNDVANTNIAPQDDKNIVEKSWSYISEIGTKIWTGFLEGVEGAADFLATIAGGEKGAEWAKLDIAHPLAEMTMYYNSKQIGLLNILKNNESVGDYFKSYADEISDIGKILSGQNQTNFRQLRSETTPNEVYDAQNGVDDFVFGISESFGQMLPSIALGQAAGTEKVADIVGKVGFGLSAAGNATQEALNDGATRGQAIAYGVGKGATEVATEIFVGKALNGVASKLGATKVGKALKIDKLAGEFGNNLNGFKFGSQAMKNATTKEMARAVVTSMFEEGMEEVASDLVAPLWESIYKGTDALKQYVPFTKENLDWVKNMGLSFASGAVMGGITTGSQNISLYRNLGVEGINASVEINNILDKAEEYYKLKESGATQEQLDKFIDDNKLATKMKDFFENVEKLEKENPVKYRNLVNALYGNIKDISSDKVFGYMNESLDQNFLRFEDGKVYTKLGISVESKILDDSAWESVEAFEKATGKTLSEKQRELFEKAKNSKNYQIGATKVGSKIYIPSSKSTQLNALYGHEVIAHAFFDLDSDIRNALVSDMRKESNTFNDAWESAEKEIRKKYKNIAKNKDGSINKETIMSETFAKVVEDNINLKSFWDSLSESRKSRLRKFFDNVANKLKGKKGDLQKSTLNDLQKYVNEVLGGVATGVAVVNKAKKMSKTSTTNSDDLKFSFQLNDDYIQQQTKEYNKITKPLFDEIENEAQEYEDNYVGETDERDAYLSKRYVNKINRRAEKIYDAIQEIYDGYSISDYSDFNVEVFNDILENYANNEDFIENLQNVMDGVDSSEYPNDEPPEYDYIQQLSDYLYDLSSNADEILSDYEDYLEEKKLEETSQNQLVPLTKNNIVGTKTPNVPKTTVGSNLANSGNNNNNNSSNSNQAKSSEAKENTKKSSNKTFDEQNRTLNSLILDSANLNNINTISFKSSEDVVKATIKAFTDTLGINLDMVDVNVEVSTKKLSQTLFEGFNLSKDSTQFNEVVDGIVDAVVNAKVETNLIENTLSDFVEDKKELKKNLKENVATLLEDKVNKSKMAKVSDYIDKLKTSLKSVKLVSKEMTQRISATRTLSKTIKKFPKHIRFDLDWSGDTAEHNIVGLLAKPIVNLSSNYKGYKSASKLLEGVNEVLANYTSDNEKLKSSYLEYDENIRNAYENLRNMLENNENDEITAEEMKQATRILKMIQRASFDQVQESKKELAPISIQAKSKMKNIKKIKNGYFQKVAARGFVIQHYLGYSEYSKLITLKMREALSEVTKYVNDTLKPLIKFVKEKHLDKSLYQMVDINGVKVDKGALLYIYASLKHNKDGKPIDLTTNGQMVIESGIVKYQNKDTGSWSDVFKVDEEQTNNGVDFAQQIVNQIEGLFSQDEITFGQMVYDFYNAKSKKGDFQFDYRKWFEDRYAVDANIVEDYMPSFRYNEYEQNTASMYRSQPVFRNEISRKKNTKPIAMRNILDVVIGQVSSFARERYVLPLYKQAFKIGNIKTNGQSFFGYLEDESKVKNGAKFVEYIHNYLDECLGIKNKKDTIMGFLATGYQLSALALNIGTGLRQEISAFNATFSINRVLKGYLSLLTKGTNEQYNDAYNHLVNDIGGLKYRSGNIFNNINRQTNNTKRFFNGIRIAVDKAGMWWVKANDKVAMNVGLMCCMNAALEDGYELGSEKQRDDFYDYVKYLYYNYDLTQINHDPIGQNELSRNEVWDLMFNKLQAPYRVMLGSMVNKVDMWRMFHNFDEVANNQKIEQLETKLADSEKQLDALNNEKTKLDEDYEASIKEQNQKIKNASDENEKNELLKQKEEMKNKYNSDSSSIVDKIDSLEEDIAETRGDILDSKNKKMEYNRFKKMGGKVGVWATILGGVLLMGLIGALIDELMQRLKGKKEWDEFDQKDFLTDIAYTSSVAWLPIFNAFANKVFKGYDLSNPSGAVLDNVSNVLVDTYNTIANGFEEKDLKTLSRDLISSLGNITGIPINNLAGYTYGFTKAFDLETALELKNVLYNVTPTQSTSAYNTYIEKGNTNKALKQLNFTMEHYKIDNSNEYVNRELVNLSMSGYNALPKNYMVSYTKDGETVKLSKQEQVAFTNIYNQSTSKVNSLINVTEYRKLTQEDRAKLIKKIYDAYYSYAKAKVLKSESADSKLSNLLYFTNGNVNINKYVFAMNTISGISDNGKKTRKELVIEYVNKLRGFTRQEKLLLLHLLGYKTNDSNTKQLKSYLTSKGVKKNQFDTLGL